MLKETLFVNSQDFNWIESLMLNFLKIKLVNHFSCKALRNIILSEFQLIFSIKTAIFYNLYKLLPQLRFAFMQVILWQYKVKSKMVHINHWIRIQFPWIIFLHKRPKYLRGFYIWVLKAIHFFQIFNYFWVLYFSVFFLWIIWFIIYLNISVSFANIAIIISLSSPIWKFREILKIIFNYLEKLKFFILKFPCKCQRLAILNWFWILVSWMHVWLKVKLLIFIQVYLFQVIAIYQNALVFFNLIFKSRFIIKL